LIMKQYKKKVLYSIISLVLAFLLTVGGIFAWFLQSKVPNVDGFVLDIVNLTGSVSDVIDINSSVGQEENPASFYPGEKITETLTLINRTDSWLKLNLKITAVGIRYNGENSHGLAEPVITAEGQEAEPYMGDELDLDDFVAPVTNAAKLIIHPLADGPTTYTQFGYITAALLATEQQKRSNEYNMVPTDKIGGLNVFSTVNRSFAVNDVVFAYMTDSGEIYLKDGYNLDLGMLLYFDPFASSTASYTDTDNNLTTVKEKSSNPFLNQNVRLVLGADLTSVTEDDLPSI
jgi:hypothetical protein